MSNLNQHFSPEVLANARRLLDIKERILEVKRNVGNAAYPAQLRPLVEQLAIALEMFIFGGITEAGSSQIQGIPAGAPDGGQRVQIFPATPTVPRPEQPALEIFRPMDQGPQAAVVAALPPQPHTAAPAGGVDAAMTALAQEGAAATAAATAAAPAPFMGVRPIRSMGAIDPIAAAAMQALENARPPAPTGPQNGSGMTVEIFPPGDPRAPGPSNG